jgi:hypothetical protein
VGGLGGTSARKRHGKPNLNHDVSQLSNLHTYRACPAVASTRTSGRGPVIHPRTGRVLRAGASLPSYFASTNAGARALARSNGEIPAAHAAVTTTRAPEVFDIVDEYGNPGTRVRHSELVQDFFVAAVDTAFEVAALAINPGLASVYPWLSQLAEAYTGYTFGELVWEYVPTIGTVNNGSVFMAPAPNVQDPLPATEEQLSAYVGAAQTAVYNDFCVHFDPASMTYGDEHDTKYVRTGLEAGDPKMFDSGQLFIASSNGPETTPSKGGALWCHYDVELFEEKEAVDEHEQISSLVTMGSLAGPQSVIGGAPVLINLEPQNPAAPSASRSTLNTLGLQSMTTMGHSAPIQGVWYIPRGRYKVELQHNCLWQAALGAASAEYYGDWYNADVGVYPDPVVADFERSTELPAAKSFRLYGSGFTSYYTDAPVDAINRTDNNFLVVYIEADQPTWFAFHASLTVAAGTVVRILEPTCRVIFTPA